MKRSASRNETPATHLNDDLRANFEDVAHTDITLIDTLHGQIFAETANLEEMLAVGQLTVPRLVVGGAVHVERLFGAAVHLIFDLVPEQARRGHANLARLRLLVNAAQVLDVGERSDLARPDAQEHVGGRKRRDIVRLCACFHDLSEV